MNSSDRLTLLMQIENDILRANPAFEDAGGLLAALHVALKRRYSAAEMEELNTYFDLLDRALNRAESSQS